MVLRALWGARDTRTTGARRERIVVPRSRASRAVGTTRWEALTGREPARRGRVRHVAEVGARSGSRSWGTATAPVARWWTTIEVVGWVRALAEGAGRRSVLVRALSTRASSSL